MSRARPPRFIRDANETRRAEESAPPQAANHSESQASCALTGEASKRNHREVRMKSISSQRALGALPGLLALVALLVLSLFGVPAFAQGLTPGAAPAPHGGEDSLVIPEQLVTLQF